MKVIFTNTGTSTGILKYTAAWLDVTYGGSGTLLSDMDTHLMKFQNADGSNSGDFVWNDGTGYKSGSCTIGTCAGGAGGTTLTVTTQLTPPATPPSPLSPLATEISVSGGNSGDPAALEWVKETPSTATDAAVSFQADWWAYLDATTSTPQTLEFDTFWGNTVHTAMFGSHCKFTSSTSCTWQEDPQDGNPSGWQDIIDAKTGSAISITLSKNAWHHITWQLHQDQSLGQIYYDYLTIDGTTYMIAYQSKVRGYKQTSSQWHTIGSQVQQDMNSAHQAYNEWIDGMTLTYW